MTEGQRHKGEIVSDSTLNQVAAYLPSNYEARLQEDGRIIVSGIDRAGWTWDDYVVPRLASGLHTLVEIEDEETQPKLRLERKNQPDTTGEVVTPTGGKVIFTPEIDEDYWQYRVIVGEHQALVGFPKFGTIGIGFAVEEDWNTNLPYTSETAVIWNHIKKNKGDARIPDEWCISAIQLIQAAVREDRAEVPA